MGQRLNLEINYKGETLANCYFHWSAYTDSTCELVNQIISNYTPPPNPEALNKDGWVLLAVRLFESVGAGLYKEDVEAFEERFPNVDYKFGESRSDGLISITEENINNTRVCQEFETTIDLYAQSVSFGVMCYIGSDERDLANYDVSEDDAEDIDFDIDGSDILFEDFPAFSEQVKNKDVVRLPTGVYFETVT